MSRMTQPAPRIPGRRLLHSPGPTPLPDAVLHAMSAQRFVLRRPGLTSSARGFAAAGLGTEGSMAGSLDQGHVPWTWQFTR